MSDETEDSVKQPAATAISRRLAPGGGGGGAWLGGPKTASSEKFGNLGKRFNPLGQDLFGEDIKHDQTGKIRELFDFPPFSVLNAREGPWQERKRAWLATGIQSEVGRGENLLKMSDTLLEPDPEKRAEMQAARGDGGKGKSWERKQLQTSSLETLGALGTTTDPYRKAGQEVEGAGASGTSIFDPVLCELMYRWFCPAGGLILDPFAGGSVRGIVAGLLGYSYLGIDLRPEQIAANETQRATIAPEADINWIVGDSNVVLKDTAIQADFIFSCPPYGDLEQYSDDPTDLSSMSWEGFVGIYRAIIRKAVERLKPDRFACFVVGEYRDKETGLYRGFVPLTCASFMAAGAALYNEAILVTAVGSLPIRVTKQFQTTRKLGKTHQNVIICCKGDPRRAAEACRQEAPRGLSLVGYSGGPASAEAPQSGPPGPGFGLSEAPSALGFALEPQAQAQALPALMVEVSEPRGGSLADLLNGTTHRSEPSWQAQEPPQLDNISDIVLNFETNGLNWRAGDRPIGVTVGTLDGQLRRFLPFGFREGNLSEEAVKRWAQQELKNKNITNANTRFDVHMAREWGVDLEAQGCSVSDVQHYAALLDDHRKSFKLDTLAEDFLGGIEVPRIDESQMTQYSAASAAARAEYQVQLVARLRAKMWPLLDEQELQEVRQLEDDVIYPVVEMEKNGSQLDVELTQQYHEECLRRHDALMLEVINEVGFAFEHTASGWTKLLEYCHLTVPDSFAEDVLNNYDHPLVAKAQKASQYASLDSKTFAAYLKNMDANGVLHYDINQLRGDEGGTVSGRFSIGYVQQVPNHDNHVAAFGEELYPRRVFKAGEGEYLEADARQIEYRIFAHFASNPAVLKAYAENPLMSFHEKTWEMMKQHKPDMKYSWQKNMNFMKMYGGGLAKLALMMGFISKQQYAEIQSDPDNSRKWKDPLLEQAAHIQRIYEQMMPEVAPLQARASHLAKSRCDSDCGKRGKHEGFLQQLHKDFVHRGYVKTITGRRSRFPNNWKTYRALNRVIQGSAADVMKRKLVELHKARRETGLLLRLTVHDQVGGDAREPETKQKVAELLNAQSFPQLKVPILWSVNTGANWAEAK